MFFCCSFLHEIYIGKDISIVYRILCQKIWFPFDSLKIGSTFLQLHYLHSVVKVIPLPSLLSSKNINKLHINNCKHV